MTCVRCTYKANLYGIYYQAPENRPWQDFIQWAPAWNAKVHQLTPLFIHWLVLKKCLRQKYRQESEGYAQIIFCTLSHRTSPCPVVIKKLAAQYWFSLGQKSYELGTQKNFVACLDDDDDVVGWRIYWYLLGGVTIFGVFMGHFCSTLVFGNWPHVQKNHHF